LCGRIDRVDHADGALDHDHQQVIAMSKATTKAPEPEKIGPQESSSSLRGYPGYRTRDGRSGLDPIDNDAEGGHMAGVFLRHLLTGRLHTRNPQSLFLWAVLGLGCVMPMILAILEALHGNLLPFGAWVMIAIAGLLGIAWLANLINNLLHFREK
jgi:hypothetical protein